MKTTMTNPYETLGVAKTATAEEIKSAYRKKAKEYHPDLHPDDPHATEKMNEINQAYEILSDANKKAMYDAGYTDSQGSSYGNSNFRWSYYDFFTGARYGNQSQNSGQNGPYGSQQNPYGSQQNPYGSQQNPYGSQQNPYGRQNSPYNSNGKGRGLTIGPVGRRLIRLAGLIILWRLVGRFIPFWFFFF